LSCLFDDLHGKVPPAWATPIPMEKSAEAAMPMETPVPAALMSPSKIAQSATPVSPTEPSQPTAQVMQAASAVSAAMDISPVAVIPPVPPTARMSTKVERFLLVHGVFGYVHGSVYVRIFASLYFCYERCNLCPHRYRCSCDFLCQSAPCRSELFMPYNSFVLPGSGRDASE